MYILLCLATTAEAGRKEAMAGEAEQTLETTPTWALATVCAAFVFLSLLIERSIFYIAQFLKTHRHTALLEALEKIKEELMLIGFISLLLTAFQNHIANICIPSSVAKIMLPCKIHHVAERAESSTVPHQNSCQRKGKAPFVPLEGLHQLHIFISIMALIHVIYSVMIMILGSQRVHGWRAWEDEARSEQFQSMHGGQLRFTRDITFVRDHAKSIWNRNIVLAYVAAFFEQIFKSVTRTDYLTLRHGFIMTHMSTNPRFDFHKYILRSLIDDFKHVVGISPFLWLFAIIFILLNVDGWETYFWISFIPAILVLLVGGKLRLIIKTMAVELSRQHSVVVGMPLVRPSNELFWFDRPELLLSLLHFVLFQNAFELSYYIWILVSFGSHSCFHDQQHILLLARLIVGIFGQFLCGYITLPLYALVNQMGSNIKRAVFEEGTLIALKKWHSTARKNVQNRNDASIEERVSLNIVNETDDAQGQYLIEGETSQPEHEVL